MARIRIMFASAVLLALAVLLPLTGLFYGARRLAERDEQAHLERLAGLVLMRGQRAYHDVSSALRQLEHANLPACSPAHMGQMRGLVLTGGAVQEFGYFQQRRLRCTSWGVVHEEIRQPRTHFTTAEGIALHVGLHPIADPGSAMIAMQLGQHNALVDPADLVDVLVDPVVTLGLSTRQGLLLARRGPGEAAVAAGQLVQPLPGPHGSLFFAVARQGDWVAVAAEPQARLLPRQRRELLVLLPFALLLAMGLSALVLWRCRRRLSPRGELAMAVQRREFVVHYQPVIHLESGSCVGAEALVRWQRADGSLVAPDQFIPLAEDSGLIGRITEQVITMVLDELGPALAADPDLHVALNLCAEDILTGRAVRLLGASLPGRGIRPEQLLLEATERGFMDVDAARATIEEARAAGHTLAIDDFGTGYSSLAYLQSLPLDALKIDKRFISTIGSDDENRSLTEHIITMARALGLLLVAEGVETQVQADYLRARGVHFVQGWLYARAMPAEAFLAFYHQHRPRDARPTTLIHDTSRRTPRN